MVQVAMDLLPDGKTAGQSAIMAARMKSKTGLSKRVSKCEMACGLPSF